MDKALEDAIKVFMAEQIAEGISLSDIQNNVNEKFSCKMTYMEIRILASSLDVDWKARDPQPAAQPEAEDASADAAAEAPDTVSDGKTVVEVNKLVRPGTALSGTVKFASGSTADWYVDQMGRLGIENLQGDQPTQEDVQAFQIELERAITGGNR